MEGVERDRSHPSYLEVVEGAKKDHCQKNHDTDEDQYHTLKGEYFNDKRTGTALNEGSTHHNLPLGRALRSILGVELGVRALSYACVLASRQNGGEMTYGVSIFDAR